MSIRRVSSSQLVAPVAQRNSSNNFPKWSEMMVNLSVKEQKKVTRKLKLVGDPYEFTEYVDKQYVPNPDNDPRLKGKTIRVPFPDADVNKSFTRIGNDDEPTNCPWKKLGYISTTQYAQNCLEKQDDGSWVVKVLKKGKSIFRDIAKEQIDRYTNEDLDDDDPRHFGTRNSPCVRITAEATGLEGPKSVEYKVSYDPKSTYITDEMIEQLRRCGEPSPQELADERASYIKDAKTDPYMPEWEDFYFYGYPLHKIFKHTPIKNQKVDAITAELKDEFADEDIQPDLDAKPVVKSKQVEEDDDAGYTVKPAKAAAKPAPKPVVVEDEDDDDSMGWMAD
jgi:hypothetical protein